MFKNVVRFIGRERPDYPRQLRNILGKPHYMMRFKNVVAQFIGREGPDKSGLLGEKGLINQATTGCIRMMES